MIASKSSRSAARRLLLHVHIRLLTQRSLLSLAELVEKTHAPRLRAAELCAPSCVVMLCGPLLSRFRLVSQLLSVGRPLASNHVCGHESRCNGRRPASDARRCQARATSKEGHTEFTVALYCPQLLVMLLTLSGSQHRAAQHSTLCGRCLTMSVIFRLGRRAQARPPKQQSNELCRHLRCGRSCACSDSLCRSQTCLCPLTFTSMYVCAGVHLAVSLWSVEVFRHSVPAWMDTNWPGCCRLPVAVAGTTRDLRRYINSTLRLIRSRRVQRRARTTNVSSHRVLLLPWETMARSAFVDSETPC